MVLNRKGFTLVEVMVAMSLLAILMISVQGILKFGILNSSQSAAYYTDKVEARYAMNKIINVVKTNLGTTFDSTNKQIMASDGTTVLVNATPTSAVETGDIYYYFDPDRFGTGDGYGEIRRQTGEVLAKDIKDFRIEADDTIDPTHKLLKITIKSGKHNSGQLFQFSTYVQLY